MTIGFSQGFALVVGVAGYSRVRPLPATVLNDARDFYQLLTSSQYCGYPAGQIRLLLDQQANAAGMRAGLEWLTASAGPEDTVLFFFSGHGGRLANGSQAGHYLLPYDCDLADLNQTAISGDELTARLADIQARRLLAFFDCCYAGGTGEVKDLEAEVFKDGIADSYYERLAQGSGRVIMASSRSDEVSLILPRMKNSLFTHSLMEALQGSARTRNDGLVRVFDVFEYVSETVPARGNQHPIFKAADLENNFPIALHLGGKAAASPAENQPVQATVDKRILRQALVQSFSLEELEVLCADIQQILADDGIDLPVSLEMAGGSEKPAKVLKLIEYLDRRGHLGVLAEAVRRERPGIITNKYSS